MVTLPRRLARAKQLIRLYRNARKASSRRLRQRKRDLLRHLRHLQFPSHPSDDDLSSLSSLDDFSTSSSSSSSETSTTHWSEILGPDWRDIAEFSDIPNPLSEGFDIDHSSLSSSSDSFGSDPQPIENFESDLDMLDCDADDEESEDSYDLGSEMDDSPGPCPVDRWARLRMWVLHNISDMYTQRYEVPREPFPRGPSYLHHVLRTLKNSRPDHFRQELRVSPHTFDSIVAAIEANAVFFNNSQNAQIPVEEQLAITLYRFGHDGNAASLQSVANWAGVGKGTVLLATRRVMTAILHPDFMKNAVRFPTDEEKAEAKEWIVSLPNLRIIDFGYGYTGSTHDSTAWEGTALASNPQDHLAPAEWVWADSAYPISSWVVAPYKRPERDLPENTVFNNHVSILRIRSEHAIGFLKGRFHSLKNLRLRVDNKEGHIIATYWVAACIGIHSFAMQCEEEERKNDEGYHSPTEHPFIAEGLSSASDMSETTLPQATRGGGARLRTGKAFRQQLKEKLFISKQRRAESRRNERLHLFVSDSDDSS
ncbi:hypothetical protein ONZ45_g11386 [Pleurotus djamor]|nr:hypothetical protein ONZ45_g11386 [Pleurotus djamor]